MKDETPYIEPNLLMSLSFESLLDDYKKYGKYLPWLHSDEQIRPKDILNQKVIFVVGEPGQGKTRLLSELYKLTPASYQKIKIDLKLRGRDESLGDFITTQTTSWITAKPSIVLLDGLDEIAQADVLHAIRRIREYMRNNPQHTVVIASRLHYFAQYEAQFTDLQEAKYVLVEPLGLSQAKRFLRSLGIENAKIETVVKSLRFKRDDPLVIQNPRYLEFLAVFLKANPSVTKNINRAMIFSNFVDNALKKEDEDNSTSLKEIKRKFLERLALTMEIAQVNTITERDFVTFLDTANSDAKLALLTQVTVENLYVHSLLKKDKDGEISFDNAETQEYLAANAILDMKDQWHVVFELAIDPNLRELYPSWENTMSFLVDEMPELLPELANLRDNPDAVAIDEAWHRLLTGSTSLKLTDSYKRDIFKRVLDYYFDRNLSVADEIAFNLANYALTEHVPDLIQCVLADITDEASRIKLMNATRLLAYMVTLSKLSHEQEERVKKRLLELAMNTEEAHVKREMIDGLGEFKDETVLSKLLPLTESTDSLVLNALQYLAIELNRNSDAAIKIFTAGMKNQQSNYGKYGLLGVDSPDGIRAALEVIATDRDVLFPLIEHETLFKDEETEFLAKVNANWQESWLPILKQIIVESFKEESGYYAVRSLFINKMIKLISEKDTSYFVELLNLATDEKRFVIDEIRETAAIIMRKADTKVLADTIIKGREDFSGRWLFSILRTLPTISNPDGKDIEQEARLLLSEEYKAYDEAIRLSKEVPPSDSRLDGLNKHIKEAREGSLGDVAKAMRIISRDNNNDLIKLVPEVDLEYLWAQAKTNFLDKYDPADIKVTITSRSPEGNQSYNISSFFNIFCLSVEYGFKVKRSDMVRYRTKLINLIPVAYSDSLSAALSVVGEMTSDEQQIIVNAYSDLSSDKAQFMLQNLLEVTQKYNILAAVPILDKIVDLESIQVWNREEALELSETLAPNKERLRHIFDMYINKDNARQLSIEANNLLISKHNDEEALRWLIKYVQNAAFEFVEQSEIHSVDAREDEIHDGKIIAPLNNVKDPKYIDLYLELWQTGVELMAKGITWQNYAYYLWKVVGQYFSNLVIDGNYEPLRKLEKYVSNHENKVASARYINYLNSIKQTYLSAIGKPASFADAINKHNELSTKNYIAVNSNLKLFEVIYSILDKDWREWITQEGRVFVLEKPEQRYLFIELQNLLLRSNFPHEGLRVLREAEAVDGTGTDFLIYYNFYGPVVIELKRSGHGDLKGKIEEKESYASLKKYMREFSAERGVFLVYDDQNMSDIKWSNFSKKITESYEKIDGVSVITVRVVVKQKIKSIPKTSKSKQK